MSLVLLDGFDHYSANAHLVQKWSACSHADMITAASSARGGRILGLASGRWIQCNVPAAQQTSWLTFGFAVYRFSGSSTELVLNDSAGLPVFKFVIATDGSIQIYIYASGAWASSGSSATNVVPLSTWKDVAFALDLQSGNTGGFKVCVNGAVFFNYTNTRTNVTGGADVLGSVRIANTGTIYLDDAWVMNCAWQDTTGHVAPSKVYTFVPTGAGDVTQLAAFGSAANWSAVADATPPPSWTKFVSSFTTGARDLYAAGPVIAATGGVFGVALRLLAGVTGSVTGCACSPVLKAAGTNPGVYVGAAQNLTSAAVYKSQVYDTNPAGSPAPVLTYGTWRTSEANALQIGVQLAAPAPAAAPAGSKYVTLSPSVLSRVQGAAYSVRVTARVASGTLARPGVSVCTPFVVADENLPAVQQIVAEVLFGLYR